MKLTWLNIISRCVAWFFGIIGFTYLIVCLVTMTDLKYELNSEAIHSVSSNIKVETVRSILAQELTPLRLQENDQSFSLSNLALQLATTVNLKDSRSLFGREIPGIDMYHTEIVVAGKGTDITTLPVESPPPTKDALKEHDVNQEELDTVQKDPNTTPIDIKDKTVFIYHSHSWEAFKPLLKNGESIKDPSSNNEKVNVIAVGEMFKDDLEAKGIGVIHDHTNVTKGLEERGQDYYSSYSYSKERIQQALAQQKRLSYFIDIHRDASSKKMTTTTINGKSYARFFFIVGKENKDYEKNLQLAKELNAKLEEKYPGISRGVLLKSKSEGNGVYNQDISDRALLLEFGGVDNNLTELSNSAKAFAEIFSDYYWQAEEVNG